MFKRILLGALALAFAFIAYLFIQADTSAGLPNPEHMPTELKPCPDKPNCVSTQAAQEDKKREPISYSGNLEQARTKLLKVLDDTPRTNRVTVEDKYVHYTFKTWPIPFTDDVEFLFDDQAKVIHYRSASRVGHSDLGVNSKRMAKLVAAYAAD